MKNLPEIKFWKEIKSRLQNFSEDPADDWDKIAARIPAKNSAWTDNSGHALTTLSLLFLLFLITPGNNFTKSVGSKLPGVDVLKGTLKGDTLSGEPKSTPIELSMAPLTHAVPDDEVKGKVITSLGKAQENVVKKISNVSVELSRPAQSITTSLPDLSTSLIKESGSRTDEVLHPSLNERSSQLTQPSGSVENSIVVSTPETEVEKDSLKVVIKTTAKKKILSSLHPELYFTITPSLGYYKLIPFKDDNVVMVDIKKEALFSTNRIGIQIEGGLQKSVSKKFEIFIGANYYSQHTSISYRYLSGTVEAVTANKGMSYSLSPLTETKAFNYSLRNAGASAGLFYRFKDGKLSHKIGGALQYQKAFVTYDVEASSKKSSFDFLNYQVLYRFQVSFTKKIDCYIQPAFTRSVVERRVSQEPFKIKPYHVGIGLGMTYRF
jgi:hypothetical protein